MSLSEGDMTICSPSTGNIALGLRPRAILPASGEQIAMSPSLKGNNCILTTNYIFSTVEILTHVEQIIHNVILYIKSHNLR